ncbi:MAG: hypothetical protein ACYDCO_25535 [Armatimonadota bacterium]
MDGEDFRDMRKARQASHQRNYEQNMAILRQSGLKFEERSTSVLFREYGKPRVDFFPHTGAWRLVGKPTGKPLTYSGGASRFISWYRQQSMPSTLDFNDETAKYLTTYAKTMGMSEWRVARLGDKYQIVYASTGTEVCELLTEEGVEDTIESAAAGYAEEEI